VIERLDRNLGDVAGEPGERGGAGGHHFVDARRGREEPGEIAYRELDAVEDLGQRHQIAQLRQAAERLHPADDGVERLPVARRGLQRAGGAIQGAGDQRSLASDEGAHAGVELAGCASTVGGLGRRPPRQRLQGQGQAARPHRVAIVPLADPPHQDAKLLDRLGHLLPAAGIPFPPPLSQRAGDRLHSACRARDGLLRRHQRGATEHPAGAEEVLGRGRVLAPGKRLQPVETLAGFQREEIRGGQGVGHFR
jgi:hypothetical protein